MITEIKGIKFDLDLKDAISRMLLFTGFENADLYNTMGLLDEGDTVFDVGANIGVYSLYAAMFISNIGKVYSYEPDSYCYSKLERNIALNSHDPELCCIHPLRMALWNKCELVHIVSEYNELDHSQSRVSIALGNYPIVPASTLDFQVGYNLVDRIKLLKIDVEGAELKVLEGAKETLAAKKIQNILIEINDVALARFDTTRYAIFHTLREAGFGVHWAYESLYNQLKRNPSPVGPNISVNILFSLMK